MGIIETNGDFSFLSLSCFWNVKLETKIFSLAMALSRVDKYVKEASKFSLENKLLCLAMKSDDLPFLSVDVW